MLGQPCMHTLEWALGRTSTTVGELRRGAQDEGDHQRKAEDYHGAVPDDIPTDTSRKKGSGSGKAPCISICILRLVKASNYYCATLIGLRSANFGKFVSDAAQAAPLGVTGLG